MTSPPVDISRTVRETWPPNETPRQQLCRRCRAAARMASRRPPRENVRVVPPRGAGVPQPPIPDPPDDTPSDSDTFRGGVLLRPGPQYSFSSANFFFTMSSLMFTHFVPFRSQIVAR